MPCVNGLTTRLSCGIMEVDKLRKDARKVQEKIAELIAPGFTYYEQELIRRVLKAVLSQMNNSGDVSTARGILKKTEWLDG